MRNEVFLDARRAAWNPYSGTGIYATNLVRSLGYLRPTTRIGVLRNSRFVNLGRPRSGPLERSAIWAAKLLSDWVEVPMSAAGSQLTHLLYPEGYAPGPFVVTVQDLSVRHRGNGYPSSFRYYAWRTRSLVRRAVRVLCPSAFTAAQVKQLLGRTKGVHVIHLGVEAPAPDSDSVDRATLPFLLYTGGGSARKNLAVLLEAWRLIRRNYGGELFVTGASCDERLRAAPGIRYLGPVERRALWDLYRKADAVIYPSTEEGFGFPILEGALLGRPVVCGAVGIVPELEPGLVLTVDVRSPKAIATAVERTQEGWLPDSRAVDRARSHFTWNRCAEETIELYGLCL